MIVLVSGALPEFVSGGELSSEPVTLLQWTLPVAVTAYAVGLLEQPPTRTADGKSTPSKAEQHRSRRVLPNTPSAVTT